MIENNRFRSSQPRQAPERYAAVSPNSTETKMNKRKLIYFLLIGVSISGILITPYGIVNTMVSLKYETENITDCISNVSGENLCHTIRNLKIAFVICLLSLIALIYFRKRILKLN